MTTRAGTVYSQMEELQLVDGRGDDEGRRGDTRRGRDDDHEGGRDDLLGGRDGTSMVEMMQVAIDGRQATA